MREVENLEAGISPALGVTAFGLMHAASAIGDAVGAAIRRRAYLQRVDTLTRQAVRSNATATRTRAGHVADAKAFLAERAIRSYNDSLRDAA